MEKCNRQVYQNNNRKPYIINFTIPQDFVIALPKDFGIIEMIETNTNNDTLISFIIPLYSVKKRDFIRCMDSIYSQNIDNSIFEVICVDDCSPTSETEEIVATYKYNAITPPI